ncbi:MAG: thiamine-phosphate kinase [Xanthomonadales bacterium]|nr:thiamine-phosphate kinase [Xanthomonadales bacterium]
MKEFELIRQIQQETSAVYPNGFEDGVKLGIGDDAAVLEVPVGHYLVAATDTLNSGTHFPVNTSPFDIGYKCLAVNLSDLAAMGAIPRWALLSLSLPEAAPEWVHLFSEGFNTLAKPHNVRLVGGDTTSGPLSISLTALGIIEPGRQLMRSGANPGDLVVVSGTIGGAAHALEMLQAGKPVAEQHLLDRPQPRVNLGQGLAGHASACIDISDGLLADLGHILRASACGARIELEKLPQTDTLAVLEDETRWDYQLSGGDDYELLFTLPHQYRDELETWRQQLEIQLSVIGEIESDEGIRCVHKDGSYYQPHGIGFEHFRRTS